MTEAVSHNAIMCVCVCVRVCGMQQEFQFLIHFASGTWCMHTALIIIIIEIWHKWVTTFLFNFLSHIIQEVIGNKYDGFERIVAIV